MKWLMSVGCAVLAAVTSFASAADARGDAQTLRGHYYLEGGPRETGSELILRDTGQFEWGMTYGARDLLAKGRWERTDNRIVLTPARPNPAFRVFEEDDYGSTRPAEPGSWIAIVGVPHVGPVADTQVRFEARSGKTADAVSKPNGDAIVHMPAGETWVRAGLRSGDDEPWQWFPIPPARAATRLVGFALTNIESVQPVPFKSFTLLVGPNGLVPADPDVELVGTYVKH